MKVARLKESINKKIRDKKFVAQLALELDKSFRSIERWLENDDQAKLTTPAALKIIKTFVGAATTEELLEHEEMVTENCNR